jgi:hypothetical protein
MAMSTIRIRLPESLYEKAREVAEKEKVSVNQLVTLALAEKLSALMTEEYLNQRAAHGDREKFHRALANVPDVEPDPEDRL